jgi:hypothetical protein
MEEFAYWNDVVWQLGEDHILVRALRRGIGVHHAGLPTKLRQLCEEMFRFKALGVVFATGSLAMGVHMPARSVLFVGDSVHMNALSYFQGSGRAGRRGFDPVGSVMFVGMPLAKMQQLVLSGHPRMFGHFPLTCSHMMRCALLSGAAAKDGDKDTVKRVVQSCRALLYESFVPFVLQPRQHYYRFGIELLRRLGHLGSHGQTLVGTALITHLHYWEPGNLVFVDLLARGVWHRMVTQRTAKSIIHRTLVTMLAHLFGRYTCNRRVVNAQKRRIGDRLQGKLVLPSLTAPMRAAIDKYNAQVLSVLEEYVRHYVTVLGDRPSLLPMTEITHTSETTHETFTPVSADVRDDGEGALEAKMAETADPLPVAAGEWQGEGAIPPHSVYPTYTPPVYRGDPLLYTTEGAEEGSLVQHLADAALHVKARSAFCALSGADDRFGSGVSLVSTLRLDLGIDDTAVPVLEVDTDGQETQLNAYALDFFVHGQLKLCIEENGLKAGEAWEQIRTFSLTLRALLNAMVEMVYGTKGLEHLERHQHAIRSWKFHSKRLKGKTIPRPVMPRLAPEGMAEDPFVECLIEVTMQYTEQFSRFGAANK